MMGLVLALFLMFCATSGYASDANGDGVAEVPNEFATLDAALAAARINPSIDTIQLAPQTHHGNFNVNVPGLTIRGQDRENCRIDADGSGSPFTISASNVTIFRLTTLDAGASHADIHVTSGSGVLIQYVKCSSDDYGVLVDGSLSPRVDVDRCEFVSLAQSGVTADGNAQVQISNSLFKECFRGVYAGGSSDVDIINNTIDCHTGQTGYGIYIDDFATPLIQNNNITEHQYGIFNNTLSTLTPYNNNVYGTLSPYPGRFNTAYDKSWDPDYIDYNTFELNEGSPCIDAGRPGTSLDYEFDLSGDIRPQGSAWDIGCQEAAGGSSSGYSNADLDGGYAIHDIFALLDGDPEARWGERDFDGTDSVDVVEYSPSRSYDQTYSVESSASFSYSSPDYGTGDLTGTVGLGGNLVVHSRYAASGEDGRITEGYAGFRTAVRLAASAGEYVDDSDLVGTYSYHALAAGREGGQWVWRSLAGVARCDGEGLMARTVEDDDPVLTGYTVSASGRTEIEADVDDSSDYTTLLTGGDLMLQTRSENLEYKALAFYLRRGRTASANTCLGTYRVHEVIVNGDAAQIMGVGTVETQEQDGDLVYLGQIARSGSPGKEAFNGLLTIDSDGTLTTYQDEGTGAVGANGDVIVITKTDGVAEPGSTDPLTNQAWMQIWVRVEGTSTTSPIDSDNDGLTNADEAEAGTEWDNPDTDGDGIPDGADPAPTEACESFSVSPTQLSFTTIQGEDPNTQQLDIGNDCNPFFSWTASASQSWITINPASDQGTGTALVSVGAAAADLRAENSPYTGTVTISAEGMTSSPIQVPVSVTVEYPAPELAVDPESVSFLAIEGATALASQSVALSNATGEASYSWTASALQAWISVSPTSGSGDEDVTITVDPDGMTASGSPYESYVRFTAAEGGDPVDLPVLVTVQEPRELEVPFDVLPSAVSQEEPAVAYDAGTHRYAVAWQEGTDIRAMLLDGNADPAGTAIEVTSETSNACSNPTVVAVPKTGCFWVIWQQATSNGVDLMAREIGLSGGKSEGDVFDISGAPLTQASAAAIYNAATQQVAVAYTSKGTDIWYTRFDPSTHLVAGGTVVTTDATPADPHIALDGVHGEYLIVWADESGAGGTESRVRARRVNPSSDALLDVEYTLEDTGLYHRHPQAAYDAAQDEWLVHWAVQEGSTTETDLWLAQFPANTDSPSIETQIVLDEDGSASGPVLALSGPTSQALTVWCDTDESPDAVAYRRIPSGALATGPRTLLPSKGATQDSPAVAVNSDDEEFLILWRDGATIRGYRLAATTDDSDFDGLPDDFENTYGLNAYDPTGDNGPDGDPDGDGLTNLEEYERGTDPTNKDTDDDGLTDPQEDLNGNGVVDPSETDPTLADSDADGFNDGSEWFLGTNGRDGGDTPPTAIYAIEHDGAFEPGVATEVKVRIAIAAANTFFLNLNSTGAGWEPPSGWTAAVASGESTSQAFLAGTYTYHIAVTPPASVTAANAHGLFEFGLTNGVFDESLTANFVCDTRTTYGGGASATAQALAERYAPVLRLHRDESYAPTPVEVSIGAASLQLGNGHTLQRAPLMIDLAQSAQEEAALDLGGDTAAALRTLYGSESSGVYSKMYYTVTEVGSGSQEAGATASDIAIQYYIHFFADEWGATTGGGHTHEGDWEVVQVLLTSGKSPKSMTVSQQPLQARDTGDPGAATLTWAGVERADDTHPVLYVADGSHSMHFWPGSTRWTQGLEVHDGQGAWCIPYADEAFLVDSAYGDKRRLVLEALPRLTEDNVPEWLTFAGHWGQDAFPAEGDDLPTASTQDGPQGPVFMGTADTAGSATNVYSVWVDPYAWYARAAAATGPADTTVSGTLPASLYGKYVVLGSSRGAVYRGQANASTGEFAITVPAGVYTLCVVDRDADTKETFLAVASFPVGGAGNNLFPTQASGGTLLGTFSLAGGILTGSTVWDTTDADGDGTFDSGDADCDGDGVLNNLDDDRLGDGFLDTFLRQDSDGDFIPHFYDSDDAPDPRPAEDTDEDGYIDEIDVDIDNDGFFNVFEIAAGTSPYLYFDTPIMRMGDVNSDGDVNVIDLQLAIRMALGIIPETARADFDWDGEGAVDVNVLDIQKLVNRILGIV